jgi:phosphohistidine phosphatase SixA
MSVLIIRHGLSEANNRNNLGTLAFASGEAPLMEHGREQARLLGKALAETFGIVPADKQVATSEMTRTQETALEAGFQHLSTYAILNEVSHGMELADLRAALDKKQLPAIAIEAAEAILETPPNEDIWFSHGLVIASLCQVLGVAQSERFIPKFCEIRELPLA